MKFIIPLICLMTAPSTWASFYNKCIYKAEVFQITELATMNEPVEGNFQSGKNTYSKLLELKLSHGQIQPGSHTRSCVKIFTEVLAEDNVEYYVGQKLKIIIEEANSRGGHFSYSISTK